MLENTPKGWCASLLVVACSAAGGPTDQLVGTEGSGGEGTPGTCEVVGWHAAPWVTCQLSGCPDIWDERQGWSGEPPGGRRPTDGATYLAMFCANGSCMLGPLTARDAVGQELCGP